MAYKDFSKTETACGHQTAVLVKCTDPNAQCSRCDSFRPNQSICTLKLGKPVKWYNKCNLFKDSTK